MSTPRSHQKPRRVEPAAVLALLLALCPLAAHALSTDRQQPLDVDANYFRTAQGGNAGDLTILSGDVRLNQGSIKAHGDEAKIYRAASGGKASDEGRIERVVLTGKPAQLEQMQDNDGGLMTSRADTIDYRPDTGNVEMTGNVFIVQQGRGEFRGAHMTYNTNTGLMQSGDNSAAGRVHLRMLPSHTGAAKPAEKSTPAPLPAKGDESH